MKRMYYLIIMPLLLLSIGLKGQIQVSFNPTSATLQVGQEATFILSINSGYTNILGGEFGLSFDTNRVEFVSAVSLIDTGVFQIAYHDGKDPSVDRGHGIRIVWFEDARTIPNGTQFMSIKLRGKSPGTTALRVNCNPLQMYVCEIFNNIGNNLSINQAEAPITVLGNVNAPTFIIGNVTGPPGSVVCVPVTVNNFSMIEAFTIGFTWNPSILTLQYVENCHPSLGVTCGVVPNNSFGQNMVNNHNLFLPWFDQAGIGISLPNGTVLFEMCFTVTGTMGQTAEINFWESQVPFEQPKTEVIQAPGVKIQPILVNGGVTIGTSKTLTINIPNIQGCISDTVCVPIRAIDFKNIEGMTISFIADPTKLKLLRVEGCNTKLKLPQCFFPSGTFFVTNDTLAVLILDQDPVGPGLSLDSNEIMFYLCYENLMAEGDSAQINIVDTQLANVEAVDKNGETVGVIRKPGKVHAIKCDCDINIIAATVTNAKCFGGSDGAINLITTGGSGNFTYIWSPTLPDTKNPTNIPAGTYKVTIIDNTIPNCQKVSNNINVAQAQDMSIDFTVSHESCPGEADGSINLTITGGTGNKTVNWGSGLTGLSITNLAAGNYTPTVTDANGCVKVGQQIVVLSSTLNVPFNSTNVSCFGAKDGTITITLPSTGGPYTVTWSPAGTGSGPNLTNLSPGMYTPSILIGTDCTVELEPIIITEPQEIQVSGVKTDINCHGTSTGTITLNVSGGQGQSTYLWNDNAVSKDRINLPAGNYSVTVTDGNNCKKTATFSIQHLNTAITVVGTVVNANQGQLNGSITLTVSGGLPPYTYLWSPGNEQSKDLTGKPAGTYSVTVTDAAGCTRVNTSTINTIPDGNPMSVFIQLATYPPGFNVSCNGACDGTAVAFPPNSAVQPVTYKWSTSAGGGTSAIATNLCAGMISVTVTDATGAKFTGTAVLTSSPAWQITVNTAGDPPYAAAYVSISGPLNQPYEFEWSNGEETDQITDLLAGKYCVTVTNVNGCTKTACADVFDMKCLQAREVITPNGDGRNDFFVISCAQDDRYRDHVLTIYNRWGQLVFTTTNYQNNWHGTTNNGTILDEGLYMYVFEYIAPDGENVIVKGTINLIR